MDIKKKLEYQSNYWYNDGLKRAQIQDMTGAIASLRRSLQYSQSNITARNLLGLLLYGRGEVAEALVQWIISRNFQASGNIAEYYIQKVQSSKSELEVINQVVKKYNQCLQYCSQGGEDLAIIQLKKVVTEHPSFLKAYQLLGLLYLHTEQYGKARQVLRKAHRLDTTDPITLSYLHELNRVQKKKAVSIKEGKEQPAVSYKLGNETIIQPAQGVRENSPMFTIVNIAIGILVGAAVMWFLIMPAVNQSKSQEANESIVEASDQIATQKSEISALKKELEGYRTKSDEAQTAKETAKSTQSSYEALLDVTTKYAAGTESNQNLASTLLSINKDSLGEDGKAQYDKLADSIFPSVCRRQYNRGIASFDVKNYDTAVEALAMVVKMDEEYDDGNAMYVLAQAYEATGDTNNAKTYYQKVTEQFSGTEMAEEAQSKLEALNAAADQNAANQNAAADQNGQGAEDSSSQEQDTTE
nr:tetratricopeptide repeat protein [uncultured Sellimonas sp.]